MSVQDHLLAQRAQQTGTSQVSSPASLLSDLPFQGSPEDNSGTSQYPSSVLSLSSLQFMPVSMLDDLCIPGHLKHHHQVVCHFKTISKLYKLIILGLLNSPKLSSLPFHDCLSRTVHPGADQVPSISTTTKWPAF